MSPKYHHVLVHYFQGGMGARLGAMTEVPITKQAIDFTDTIRGLFVKFHDMSSCIRDHVRRAIFVEKEQRMIKFKYEQISEKQLRRGPGLSLLHP